MSNLLRRRMMMAANNSSSGGGTEDESDIIYLDIVTEQSDSIYLHGYVEISQPFPFQNNINFNGTKLYKISTGETYLELIVSKNPGETIIYVNGFNRYDLNYRIIPSHIINDPDLLQYLYATNIDKIPVSEDDTGLGHEICPIKMIFVRSFPITTAIDNTDLDRWIWYNYNGEILFKDLYTGLIYALNIDGVLYQYN